MPVKFVYKKKKEFETLLVVSFRNRIVVALYE